MQIEKPCFVCEGRDYVQEFNGHIVSDHHFIKCNQCGTVLAKPAINYNANNVHDFSSYGDYLIDDKNYVLQRLLLDQNKYRSLFEQIAKRYGPHASILDIGCGAGYFLSAAKKFGFHVVGIEPSNKLRAFAIEIMGLEVLINLEHIESQCFDVITMQDVIEHIPSALNRIFMKNLIKKLKSGGILYGNTPNYQSANILIRKQQDPAIWPPSHCCYFNTQALNQYFLSFGLKKETLYTKGFRSFRSDKNRYSFIENPPGSRLINFAVVYPLKILMRIASLVVSPLGMGYQIYFCYQKTPD